jgi:hypothetical protein
MKDDCILQLVGEDEREIEEPRARARHLQCLVRLPPPRSVGRQRMPEYTAAAKHDDVLRFRLARGTPADLVLTQKQREMCHTDLADRG